MNLVNRGGSVWNVLNVARQPSNTKPKQRSVTRSALQTANARISVTALTDLIFPDPRK